MKIRVKVRPGAKVEKVELLNQAALEFDGTRPNTPTYVVSVKDLPIDGKANKNIR